MADEVGWWSPWSARSGRCSRMTLDDGGRPAPCGKRATREGWWKFGGERVSMVACDEHAELLEPNRPE